MPPRNSHQHPDHVAERTKLRVPKHCLSQADAKRVKDMRDSGMSCEDIAVASGHPLRDVELALAPTRSPNPKNPQACIYTNRTVLARFRKLGLPNEPANVTLVRLMDEHAHFERLFSR